MMTKRKITKVPITERALSQRINRKLVGENEGLRSTRPGSEAASKLGRFYIVDLGRNSITAHGIDSLEQLGRELGVVRDHEEIV